jgi:hypothetical protein
MFEELGASKDRTNTVKRRFREFINLQNRLEDNPSYKKSLKGMSQRDNFSKVSVEKIVLRNCENLCLKMAQLCEKCLKMTLIFN